MKGIAKAWSFINNSKKPIKMDGIIKLSTNTKSPKDLPKISSCQLTP
jgi:hypothetical protein